MSAGKRKAATSLKPGDRIILTPRPWPPGVTHRVHTVEHVVRDNYGIVRVFYGRYAMKSVTLAGTYMVDITEEADA